MDIVKFSLVSSFLTAFSAMYHNTTFGIESQIDSIRLFTVLDKNSSYLVVIMISAKFTLYKHVKGEGIRTLPVKRVRLPVLCKCAALSTSRVYSLTSSERKKRSKGNDRLVQFQTLAKSAE